MIRNAVSADVPAILSLVKDLARYEREPDAVANTEDELRATLFGSPHPQVYALVAEVDAGIVGTAIWFVNYSTWTGRHGIYLEDIVLSQAHRRSGVGTALMAELARICAERGYARLEWTVLDWNEPALQFYQRLGAEPMSDWTAHRISGASLAQLAALTE